MNTQQGASPPDPGRAAPAARLGWSHRLAAALESGLSRAAGFGYRRPWPVIAGALLLSLLAYGGARRLSLDGDLAKLLPESFPSVTGLDELRRRFGGIGYVCVVARDDDPAQLERLAEELSPALEALPQVRYVEKRRPVEFFTERALFYLDTPTLERLAGQLEARLRWEKRRRNPLYVDLEDAEPPPLELAELAPAGAGKGAQGWLAAQLERPYTLDPERRMLVLLVKPMRTAANLDDARDVVKAVEGVLAGFDRSSYAPSLRLDLTGRYVKRVDQQRQLQGDLGLASSLALLLMLAYLALHFRRADTVALVLLPLGLGLLWTLGLGGLAFGTLNVLTGFIGAILMGLGIDHGIHLMTRFLSESSEGDESEEDRVRRAFGSTGRAVAVAAVTTTVAFAGLAISEFRAFREFGLLAAGGMMLVLLAYTAVLPALLGLRARWLRREMVPRPVSASAFSKGLRRWAPVLAWGSFVLTFLLVLEGRSLRFDYDFSALEDGQMPSFRLDHEVNRVLGYSQTPVVVLTDDEDSERAVAAALRQRKQQLGERSTVDFVATTADLVPEDQATKAELLARLERSLRQIRPSWLEEDQRKQLAQARTMVQARPFARRDLPVEVRRQFAGAATETGQGFVLVFPSISLSDGVKVRQFAQELRGLRLQDGRELTASGEAMILADILHMVGREAPPVLLATLGLVFLSLLLMMGSLRDTLLCLLPAVGGLAATLGVMAMGDMRLNYLNIVMVPVLFGLGVDGGAHMVTRQRAGAGAGGYDETARAVSGAILTTALGFGSLLLADHPGLNSLARLALLGLACNLLASLVALPALLALPASDRGPRVGTERWRRFVEELSTVGKAGFSPVAPGTLGALAALPAGWLLSRVASGGLRVSFAAALGLLGVGVVSLYLRGRSQEDPSEVVLDEFLGVLLAFAFVPWSLGWVLAAFLLFRALDIWKPWPIRWVDRRVHGGLGVVGDDLLAGLAAGLLLGGLHAYGLGQGWWA